MATYTKFNAFVEHLAEGAHDMSTDQLTVALFAAANAPDGATDALLADIGTEVTYTYCSTRNITLTSSSQTSGTYKLVLQDLVLTATGGAVGPLRYVVIYNDGTTVLTNPLICYFDYGSEITLQDGETLTINFDDANGLFQLS